MESRPIGIPIPVPAAPTAATASPQSGRRSDALGFRQLVQESRLRELAVPESDVVLSAHARERLRVRNIDLNDDDMKRIAGTMDRVAEKGGRNSLFLLKTAGGQDTAMVVSVRNRVVITAVDPNALRENIFTNIDSAAIVS